MSAQPYSRADRKRVRAVIATRPSAIRRERPAPRYRGSPRCFRGRTLPRATWVPLTPRIDLWVPPDGRVREIGGGFFGVARSIDTSPARRWDETATTPVADILAEAARLRALRSLPRDADALEMRMTYSDKIVVTPTNPSLFGLDDI